MLPFASPARRTLRHTTAGATARRRPVAQACTALALLLHGAGALAQVEQVEQVEVVGTSPLPGLGIDRATLPYSSAVVRRDALSTAQPDHLTDYLNRRVPGMQVNDIQGSPLQADLTFRGFRASGLVGASQGLSVYLDGVRVNEPFGDVVNWDMVPEFALSSVALLPGANPAFGLNTLGGAISLTTASGRSAPGVQAEAGVGSFGRRRVEASWGAAQPDGWHSYLGGTVFREQGWRDHSPGRQALVMGKLGRSLDGGDWDLALLAGRSTLVGNGLVPAATLDADGTRTPDLIAQQRSAVFTHPDQTRNRLAQLTLSLRRDLPGGALLQALAYTRHSQRDTVNGDLADVAPDPTAGGEGIGGLAPVGAASQVGLAMRAQAEGDPADVDGTGAAAALNRTQTRQRAWGLAASLAARSGPHQWQVGATLDASRVRFAQTEQAGHLDVSRGVLAGDDPAETSAEVSGSALTLGLYATDTWRVAERTHVTGTLRYNRARVGNTLSSVDDDTGLMVHHPHERFTYHSLNPALGVLQRLGGGLDLFANLARNTRVPTVIELGCADPEEPCRLPAGLQSDPYLKPVRATSLEAGLRWRPAKGQSLELTAYRTDNRDDILFGSVSTTGQLGYFRNFDRTRHQGLDLQWQGRVGAWSLGASYSHLQATYQSDGVLRVGERNVVIAPGTRMAGLPRHSAKLSADWAGPAGLGLGADVQLVGRRGVQGNEDGRLDDAADAGSSWQHIGGYALLNLRLQWQVNPQLTLLARVNNALDRRHETFGALAETVFDAEGRHTGNAVPALFAAPGSPRSLWLGLRARF